MEQELRKQLEAALGRELSEDEWRAVAGGKLSTAAKPKSRARSRAQSALTAVAVFVLAVLAGAAAMGLLLGVVWVYHPGALEEEDTSLAALIVGGLIFGYPVLGSIANWPRASALVIGLGVLAVAIGGLLRIA